MSEAQFALAQGVRRVVTGVDANGKAVVMRDELTAGDPRSVMLWAMDTPPRAGDSAPPPPHEWWPAPGGVRVTLSMRAPEARAVALAGLPQAWPDINDAAGFHASDSVDVIIMISGRIWLTLDDGVDVVLAAGDVLIQNGTRHRWRNHGDEDALMAVVIVGAHPAAEP